MHRREVQAPGQRGLQVTRVLYVVAALAFTATPLACGSSVETTSSSGASRDDACTAIVDALCSNFQACLPFAITLAYGDVATCNSRGKLGCASSFDATKTSTTPDFVAACAPVQKAQTCTQLQNDPPALCVPKPGGLENGAGCGDDGQCKSTWCAKSDSVNCGVCAAVSTSGGACVTVRKSDGTDEKKCSRGLSCAADKCAKAALAGEACSDAKPCVLGTTCFNGSCTAAGKAGAKCDADGKTQPACDFFAGTFCNQTTGVCQVIGVAGFGEPCGIILASREFKMCRAGGKCVGAMGVTAGTCVAPAADGAACDPVEGPDCVAPAKCVEGRCKLPSASACN